MENHCLTPLYAQDAMPRGDEFAPFFQQILEEDSAITPACRGIILGDGKCSLRRCTSSRVDRAKTLSLP
jgi:hypothetical protein